MAVATQQVDRFVELLTTFASEHGLSEALQNVLPALKDAMRNEKAPVEETEAGALREILRRWRRESQLKGAYHSSSIEVFLKSLNVFRTLDVPLFIDTYGDKKLLSEFDPVENVPIDLNTPIVHVTHSPEAQHILNDQYIKPSDNKNIIAGTWFCLKSELIGDPPDSIFGTHGFETTLSQLGVTALHQGEIVAYKKQVNVILYASDTPGNAVMQKPTIRAARWSRNHLEAYVITSVFVPGKFLPQPRDEFESVFRHYQVSHRSFCVKEKRSKMTWTCPELKRN